MLGGLRRGKAAPQSLQKGGGYNAHHQENMPQHHRADDDAEALAGLLVQLNLYAPSALYKPGMALLEVGVIVAALAVAAFWPSSLSVPPIASDEEEEEDCSPEEHERLRASRGAY